jgi:hypothetical protein
MARAQIRVRRDVDPESPLDGFRVERVERGAVDITSCSFKSWKDDRVVEVFDKIVCQPKDARWLRDQLVSMDLED